MAGLRQAAAAGLDVAGPHDTEVTVVERGQLRLDHRENRAVDEADLQIAVCAQQLVDPLVVSSDQGLDYQRAASILIEHRAKGALRV
jgi:biopolymer transport protein ExbD